MARQKTYALTSSFIKPTFSVPGPFLNTPQIFKQTGTISNEEATMIIRPPRGQFWRILYASVMLNNANNSTNNLTTQIELITAAGTVYLLRKGFGVAVAPLAGEQYRITHDTNSATIIDNSNYLQLRATIDGATTSARYDMLVLAEDV